MTAVKAGAPAAKFRRWSQVDWAVVARFVHRLQERIAKAVREQRWGKARALQHLLSRSFYARLWAVRRVVRNKGKHTPGVDGVVWRTEGQRWNAVAALKRRGYRPRPLRRIYIPKANGQRRPLGIPTMHDRAMQALYALTLNPVAETTGDPSSYGFRSYRSTADAIGQCFVTLAKSCSPQWLLEADIKACFDRIDHDWLIANVPMDKHLLRAWLKAGYMEDGSYFDTDAGTPQGGIISPILANLALDGLEARVAEVVPRRGAKVNVVRYADDFIITGASEALLRDQVQPAVEAFLAERGLTLSETKTRLTHITQGFDFLGFNVRKYGGKLLIQPSAANVRRFLRAVKVLIAKFRAHPGPALMGALNARLRGFFHYYRHVVSKRCFSRMDQQIFRYLKHWASIRHRRKPWNWIKRQYFIAPCGRWHFSVPGTTKRTRCPLFGLKALPIRRHVKIRNAVNPFDRRHAAYFGQRRQRPQLLRLQDRQLLAEQRVAVFGQPVYCERPV